MEDLRLWVSLDDDNTPNTGIVLFTDSAGIPREIDFIDAPLGLGARDVRDTAVLLALDAEAGQPPVELWVMHPERCMESRVINTTVLHTTAPLAIRQLTVSVLCACEWSSYLLDSDELPQEKRVNAVLKLNERVFKHCMHDRRFRDVLHDHDINRFTQSSLTTRSCPIGSASGATRRCAPSSTSA